MNLFFFTFTTSVLLLLVGLVLISKSSKIEEIIRTLIRSDMCAVIFLIIGLFWFLSHHVQNLGEADFGEYKFMIGVIGVFIAVASYFFINDFLAVRAASIIILFYSRLALDAAFLQEPQSRLFLVSIIYLMIFAALYFGAWPYRMRDSLDWLYQNAKRSKTLGFSLIVYSFVLAGVSFTY